MTLSGFFGDVEPTDLPSPTVTTEGEAVALVPTSTATEAAQVQPSPTAAPPTPSFSPTPAVTPRGGGQGQIAFVSERVGLPQIFMMNIDGSNVRQLTTMADGACQPAWSPEGDRLLFVSPCRKKDDQYPNAAIFVMNADGSDIRPLITLVGGVFDPDWSAAGIAFTYLDDNRPRLWMANENGEGTQQISRSNAYDRQASWSPGGDKIAIMNTSRAGSATIYWIWADGSFEGSNPDQITRDQKASSPD
jgi:Tol biopolymer transport system component